MIKTEQEFYPLQSLMWPDFDICTTVDLWLRLDKGAALTTQRRGIVLADGGKVQFDTAFNVFPLVKWQNNCALMDVRLRLRGRGTFEVSVTSVLHKLAEHTVALARVVTLVEGEDQWLDLSDRVTKGVDGLLYFTLRAVGEAELHDGGWDTRQKPLRQPDMVLGITTFKREAAVQATVARFEAFAETWDGASALHMVVVDNGQSVTLPPSDKVTLVPNHNLGGSGGFARCLVEAQARGATHCTFMDDDASIDLWALPRVLALMAYAVDPKTAVNGGLTYASDPTRIWESGATFHTFSHPLFRGLDLTYRADVVHLEMVSADPRPENYYGGFWFFAFAVDQVSHWPFPFFVRGDDVNFSIANKFNFVTLPGVVSFQDTDFPAKESATTLYLDVRHHMIQHLVNPSLAVSRKRLVYIPAHFFGRSMFQNHSDTLLTLNLAVEDVLKGPEYFRQNADLAARRASIVKARKYEVWEPLSQPEPQPKVWLNQNSAWARWLMKVTLNGLLLPFFAQWGNQVVIPRGERGIVGLCFGAGRATYIDREAKLQMVVKHRKLPSLVQGLRMAWNLARLTLTYQPLLATWRNGFDGLTNETYWQGQFEDSPLPEEQPQPLRTSSAS